MRVRTLSLLAGIAASSLLCLTPSTRAADDVSSGDRKFVMDTAQANMTEIAAAKVALANSQNDEVKKFAQKMVDDHTKAGDELMAYAKGKNLEVDGTLDAKHEKMVDKLKGETGADFDKLYVKDMVKDHKMCISMFEKEVDKGDDAALKEWANKTLPTLKEHQTMVTAMADSMGMKDMGHDMGRMGEKDKDANK